MLSFTVSSPFSSNQPIFSIENSNIYLQRIPLQISIHNIKAHLPAFFHLYFSIYIISFLSVQLSIFWHRIHCHSRVMLQMTQEKWQQTNKYWILFTQHIRAATTIQHHNMPTRCIRLGFFFIPFIPSLMNNKHSCSTANISKRIKNCIGLSETNNSCCCFLF